MRIGIDISFLKDQYANRGIGFYGKELIMRLLLEQEITWVLFGFEDKDSNLALLESKVADNIEFVSLGKARKSNIINNIYFSLLYKKKIIKARLDLYFAPHLERGLPIKQVRTAVMLHDIIPMITNNYSNHKGIINYIKGAWYKRNFENAKKADLILTNSEFSKRELINKAGCDEQKIVKTYLGIKTSFSDSSQAIDTRDTRRVLMMYKIPKPYILYYGGLEANKNINNLFYAFKNVTKRFPDMRVVIVGKEFKLGWDNKVTPLTQQAITLMKLAEELKIKHNVVYTGEVEEQHLPIIMKSAEAFVHLSTYEGFGFSPLEAMVSGVACIASKRSCYPEVLQDGAELVNPKDVEKVSTAILTILEDEELKNKLIKKGLKVSQQYNWNRTTKETLTAFKNTINNKQKLKVCYVLPNFLPFKGGAENNCLNLALQLKQQGHDVTVLTSNNGSNKNYEEYQGIKIYRFKKLNKSYYFGFYPRIIKGIIESDAQIMHVHGFGFIWHDLGLIIRKIVKPRSKIINTPHGPFMALKSYSFLQKLMKFVFSNIQKLYLNRLYSTVIAVNPNQHKWISESGITSSKIKYLPNGIKLDYFTETDTADISTKYKLGKKFIITFIGRYEKYKGLQDLIAVMPQLLEISKNIKLVAMGVTGSYLPKLKQQIEQLKIESAVEIIENPEDIIIEKMLSLSKIFVLPSEWEAFGISILEAMAKGNAIISTRTEGGEFLIKEEINGFLYEFGNTTLLSEYLIKLYEDKVLIKKISGRNIKKAKQFTWEHISIDYQDILYDSLR